jgi:hypothetical protein
VKRSAPGKGKAEQVRLPGKRDWDIPDSAHPGQVLHFGDFTPAELVSLGNFIASFGSQVMAAEMAVHTSWSEF